MFNYHQLRREDLNPTLLLERLVTPLRRSNREPFQRLRKCEGTDEKVI